MRRSLLVAVSLCGCAKASVGLGEDGNNPATDSNVVIDSPNPPIDARMIDAAPPMMIDAAQTITLQQTTSMDIDASTVTCPLPFQQRDNSWYRVFALAEHGITGRPFYVKSVSFAIQYSLGMPQADIKVGRYTGTIGAAKLDLTKITPLAAASATIPVILAGRLFDAPITATIPADSQFVVEVFVNDLIGTGKSAWIGASTSAETHPAYHRSTACLVSPPKDATTSGAGFPDSHLIIAVTGQY